MNRCACERVPSQRIPGMSRRRNRFFCGAFLFFPPRRRRRQRRRRRRTRAAAARRAARSVERAGGVAVCRPRWPESLVPVTWFLGVPPAKTSVGSALVVGYTRMPAGASFTTAV